MENYHGENSTISRQGQKFLAQVTEHCPVGKMTKEEMQIFIEDKDNIGLLSEALFEPFIRKIRGGFESDKRLKQEWEYFYKKYFKLDVDLSDVKIPAYDYYFEWIIIIAKEVTLDKLFEVLKNKMAVSSTVKIEDFLINDELVNSRDPKNGNYAIRCHKNVEADYELSLLEPNYFRRKKNIAKHRITLLERLIMELVYFDETGQHLDNYNYSLCIGSRFSKSGNTILVGFNLDKLDIMPTPANENDGFTRAVKTCEPNVYSKISDTSKK